MTNPINLSPIKEIGDQDFPIWLLGDSPSDSPSAKDQDLTPLDPRHPTRHSIWTPILDVIQRRLFVERERRLDDSKLYIRNAVSHSDYKLNNPKMPEEEIAEFQKKQAEFQDKQVEEIKELQTLLKENTPFLVLCFGQFAFEFARRAQEGKIEVLRPQDWGKKRGILKLSTKFDENIEKVKLGSMTLLPLLHASAARGFQSATEHFSGKPSDKRPNYFEYVGEKIANVLIEKVLKSNHTDPKLNKLWRPTKWKGAASE